MDEQRVVARERELEQLGSIFDGVVAGRGAVYFVTGEAGAGKSRLLEAFLGQVRDTHPEVAIAVGECNAQTGESDPYLPWREVLERLLGQSRETPGTAESRLVHGVARFSADALLKYGPDLVNLLLPGSALVAKLGSLALEHTGVLDGVRKPARGTADRPAALEAAQLRKQYADLLTALASQRPLVIALDDLQWADSASVGLLFHLARSLTDVPVLLLGLYRPNDIAVGRGGERHPLEPVLNEIKRYRGDVWLQLGAGLPFMEALLDREPNRLGGRFRQALFERTNGHPLFVTELLRSLRERGDLVQDDQGRWTEGPELDWDVLPARVEGVIEERVGRLTPEQRDTLGVASVEGQEFSAEVLARVQGTAERDLVRTLARDLERRHGLVTESGALRVTAGTLSRFRFVHALFQKYLYDELSGAERRLLHADVADALEAIHGDQAAEIAPQLARHHALAGRPDRARVYLRLAARKAAGLGAYREAQMALEDVLAQGVAGLERAEVLLELAELHSYLGNPEAQRTTGEEALGLARAAGDRSVMARALNRLAWVAHQTGRADESRTLNEEALTLARGAGDTLTTAASLQGLARLDRHADPATAVARQREAVALQREAGDSRRLAIGLENLAFTLDAAGDEDGELAALEEARLLIAAVGDRFRLASIVTSLAYAMRARGDFERAAALSEEAIVHLRALDHQRALLQARVDLALARSGLGDQAGAASLLRSVLEGTDSMLLPARFQLPFRLWVMFVWACVTAQGGDLKRAAVVAGLALRHPQSPVEETGRGEGRRLLNRLQSQLAAGLPPEVVEAAMEQGLGQGVDVVVPTILGNSTPRLEDTPRRTGRGT